MKNNILNVEKWNYGNYSSDNYGANSIAIRLGTRTVYYSYDTVVAFRGTNSKGENFDCVCQNCWGKQQGNTLTGLTAEIRKVD